MKWHYLLAILLMVLVGCSIPQTKDDSVTPRSQPMLETPATSEIPVAPSQDQPGLNELKSQLRIGLRTGGITPELYTEINERLSSLERRGYDHNQIQELREMLSQLQVGGPGITENPPAPETAPNENQPSQPVQQQPQMVTWDYDQSQNIWKARGTPPPCPELIFESPIDVTKATSILYPGQLRGRTINDYKAHGGFRYDDPSVTALKVTLPFDGYVWRGSRFLVNGEIQYLFDVVHECGIMHRFGHLTDLSPEFQALAEKMTAPKEGDSRTTDLSPYVHVKKGDFLATQIKTEKNNIGVDWGVYDLRTENEASKNQTYREDHWFQRWYDLHAICWLEYLPAEEQAIVKSLPGGDGVSGTKSDYCHS